MAVGHSTTELAAVIEDLPARIYSASSTTAGVVRTRQHRSHDLVDRPTE
jgi:hypothetical protein